MKKFLLLFIFLGLVFVFNPREIREQKSNLISNPKIEKSELASRKEYLLYEIPKNPKILTENKIDQKKIPSQLVNLVEKEVTITGKLEVYRSVVGGETKESFAYKVVAGDGREYETFFVEDEKELKSATEVTITGLALDNYLVAESTKDVGISQATLEPLVSGNRSVLVILHNFSNLTFQNDGYAQNDGVTRDVVVGNATSNPSSVRNFYLENSYNNLTFNFTVTDVLTSSYSTASGCNLGQIESNADAAAAGAGFNANSYNHVIYLYPYMNACTLGGSVWAGLASWPGSVVYLNGYYTSFVMAHELGHNIGVGHANRLNCGTKVIDNYNSCTETEYGDWYDTMGNGYNHFNAGFKDYMGWLPGKVQTVTTNGTYTIYPIENNDNNVKALKIYRPNTNDYYYLEYRQPIGFDSGLTDGVTGGLVAHLSNATGNDTKLLDFSPQNNTNNVSLVDGSTFVDTANNIKFIQQSHSQNSILVQITLTSQDATAQNIKLSDHMIFNWDFPLGAEEEVNYGITNYNETDVTLDWLLVTGRDKNGAIVDFPMLQNVLFGAGETKAFQDKRYLNSLGNHVIWIAFCFDGKWYTADTDPGVRNLGYINVRPAKKYITSINFTPTKQTTTSPTGVQFTISNEEYLDIKLDTVSLGNCLAQNRYPDYNMGGLTDQVIPKRSSSNFSFSRVLSVPGLYESIVYSRAGSVWEEIRWPNNISSKTYYWVSRPSVNITDVSFSETILNQDITITFNIGNTEENEISYNSLSIINRAVDNPYLNLDFGSQANVVVGAGGTGTVELTKKISQPGLYYASLADCTSGVCNEITWANGTSSKTFYYVRKPDIQVTGVAFQNTLKGEDTEITFFVKNNESVTLSFPAISIINRLVVLPYQNLDFGSQPNITIEPGDTAQIKLSRKLYVSGLYVAWLADCSGGYCSEIFWSNGVSSKTYFYIQ